MLGGSARLLQRSRLLLLGSESSGGDREDFPEHRFPQNRPIDLEGLQRVPGKTFRWKGFYEYDLSKPHTMDTRLNVFESFEPEVPELSRQRLRLPGNIDPLLQRRVLEQVRGPAWSSATPPDCWIANRRGGIAQDHATGGHHAAERLGGAGTGAG